MGGIRTPRSVKGAQPLCERFAVIQGEIAAIENDRNAAIAAANKTADAALEPLIAESEQLREKLEPWWRASAEELTQGRRKSIELGGAVIGTRAGQPSLAVPKDGEPAKAALRKTRWGKDLLKLTVTFDKRAIAKALTGSNGPKLKALGFHTVAGTEDFVLERAEQEGTRT